MEGRSHIVLVYEPVEAISAPGQFHPDDPEHAQTRAKEIKFIVDPDIDSDIKVLYGGSVNSENVKSFVSQPDIDGVLVGQASLDSKEFVKIIRVCQGSDPRGGSDPHLL
jgi:triosephosphate isomerase